jgi:diguanylate cyclase (GGDEF)-like protein
LTGLYNRAFFEEECTRLNVERQLPISVIMGDINGLKLINDAFGHQEGDKLLIEISKILSQNCRKEDILARTGGDEFCILLPQTTPEEAQGICRRIYSDCVEYGTREDKETFYLSISLGYSTKTTPGTSIASILTEAEESMYKQKLLERKSMRSSLLSSIKSTMYEKSHLTAEHEERLIGLAKKIGQLLELSEVQLSELELLATLHDLGKLSIDDQILNKAGRLTEEEWIEVRKHPEVGYRIAQASPELAPISEYILSHHERWDGSGYPQGLRGATIPLLSRIVAVVDAYDAMTQDRSYRRAMSEGQAVAEILANAGTQFDPAIARMFADMANEAS